MSKVDIKTFPFKRSSLDYINDYYIDYPIVYFLNNDTSVYIGETVAVRNRMRDHLNNSERKSLTKMSLIIHERFNQSATYNIETKLINYFLADERYKLQNKSQTSNSLTHNYYEKKFFNEELFDSIWDELLIREIVDNSRSTIENKDLFKLSPFKELSIAQLELQQKIIEVCKNHILDNEPFVFLIKGEAGVGKSVVLSSVFNKIQELSREKSSVLENTNNYLLVNHSEMLKTYKKIAGKVKALTKKNFEKPTSFINQRKKSMEKADIVLIDEAHLLLTKPDPYNNFVEENQLQEIINHSKIIIAVYDDKQVLKMKSYWNEEKLQSIIKGINSEPTYKLTNQFRMKASNAMVNWIDKFVEKKITEIPSDPNYDFRIFESAAKMYEKIQEMNNKVGLARIVSTFDFIHKKDGQQYYVEEGDLKLPWNGDYGNITWAEEADTIREVGSIYTIQGFDLNYVGVILGPSISYDERTDELKILTENYKDTEAFRGKDEFEDSESIKEKIILNSLNVLMKRGIRGLYVSTSDSKLRARLLELQRE
ncbi:DUF2075 domain-containing protein [Bacillus sp. AFS017336]|uniref:DUF2075 domain-containing protein n=1 Tax=Bacillus sp. AFS017336 TaxID=2033489 RepID=UPI000BEF47B8|nr:DUF2075 domain-containing protein [Bacillus sp. AFS017336]PEL14313.1 endonuclease [Bacillus sp. AFS017336]